MTNLPNSEKKKKAYALGYNKDEEAPRLLAKGEGWLAEKILDLAKEMGIPVKRDSDLAEAMNCLEYGEFIPRELYEAFAVIIASLYKANYMRTFA